jgi:DNA-directed RNA polymerase sigma subunit (sigma70/sigma32)
VGTLLAMPERKTPISGRRLRTLLKERKTLSEVKGRLAVSMQRIEKLEEQVLRELAEIERQIADGARFEC